MFYLEQKDPIKIPILTLLSPLVKICLILYQIPHVSYEIRQFLVKLIHFLLRTKGSHQNPNFETFKCSSENSPYSSCHFPNHKSVFPQILHQSISPNSCHFWNKRSVFLQILHQSSRSWDITPLYVLAKIYIV